MSLYVAYRHIILRGQRKDRAGRVEVAGSHIHFETHVAVKGESPDLHARQAPPEAEWFDYKRGELTSKGMVYHPVKNVAIYVIDGVVEPKRKQGEFKVILRHSGVYFTRKAAHPDLIQVVRSH